MVGSRGEQGRKEFVHKLYNIKFVSSICWVLFDDENEKKRFLNSINASKFPFRYSRSSEVCEHMFNE